jgi:hypothetical protein
MKKSCAVGCVVVVLLLGALGVLIATKGPQWFAKGKRFVMNAVAEEQRIAAFESAWIAPSAKPDDQWAPHEFAGWRLKQVKPDSMWSELNISRTGQRMTYEKDGQTVEIGVIAANDLEKPELIKRLTDATINPGRSFKNVGDSSISLDSNTSHSTTTIGNRTHISVGSDEHTRIWWLMDWLFFFRMKSPDQPQLPEEYLKAISGRHAGEK